MARYDKSRTKSPKQDAPVAPARAAAARKAAAVEDTMFFPRLRAHAKWMFVFLALVFGVGFVAFGIGAGGTGIGDILRGSGGGDGAPSVSEAREATEENPQDAQAWRDLATAYQTDGATTEAIDALEQYRQLKPKDVDALRDLGSLYIAQGYLKRNEASYAQSAAAFGGGSTQFGTFTVAGQPVVRDPIANAIEQNAGAEVTELLSEAGLFYSKAVSVYRQIAEQQPKDPNAQYDLAQAAQAGNDRESAIAAYERYIELAPDAPEVALIKDQLKQLKGG